MKNIYLLLIVLIVNGCSTTTKTSIKYERGNLVKEEKLDPVLLSEKYRLMMTSSTVKVEKTKRYSQKTVKIYEKIRKDTYKTKGLKPTDSPFLALLATPGALIMDVVTLGTQGHTKDMWTDRSTNYESVKTKLKEDFFVDEDFNKYNEGYIMQRTIVKFYLNGKYVGSSKTNDKGYASYSFEDFLAKSNIHPKNLIHNQGVKLVAGYKDLKESYQFSNSRIKESYFHNKFESLKGELQRNSARYENCSFIANNKREFFECFYQQ